MSEQPSRITDEDVRRIAERAQAHERTVLRRLLGLHVRGRVGARVDREIAAIHTEMPTP